MLFGVDRKLLRNACFANSRLAGKHDDSALAGHRIIEGCGKLGHLLTAADETTAVGKRLRHAASIASSSAGFQGQADVGCLLSLKDSEVG